GAAAGATADALPEIHARLIRLRILADPLQNGHRGQLHDVRSPVLEIRAVAAERLEADGLELVRDIACRVVVSGRAGVSPGARRLGEPVQVRSRPRRVDLARDGDEAPGGAEGRAREPETD